MTKYFEEIEDTRQQGKIKYLLVEVIVMTITVTAGADNWSEIAMYCKEKITMFQCNRQPPPNLAKPEIIW